MPNKIMLQKLSWRWGEEENAHKIYPAYKKITF
jgi:hypothetical protein